MLSEIMGVSPFVRDVLWQSTAGLALGLLASLALARRPARAHGALVMSLAIACFAPLLGAGVRHMGWGWLPPRASAMEPTAALRGLPGVTTRELREGTGDASVGATTSAAFDVADPASSAVEPWRATVSTGDSPRDDGAGADSAVLARLASVQEAPTRDRAVPPGPRRAIVSVAIVATLWALVSATLLLRLVLCYLRGRGMVKRAEAIQAGSILSAARRAAESLSMPEPILMASAEVLCPVIWCWHERRAVLLLPFTAVAEPGRCDWHGVLVHELSHYRRRDHWTQLVAELLVCMLPWQPLAWTARRRLAELSQQACDAWAVSSGCSPSDYAQTLLAMLPQRRTTLVLAAVSNRSRLADRVRSILARVSPEPMIGTRWSAACVLVSMATMGFLASAQSSTPTPESAPAVEERYPAGAPGTMDDKPPERSSRQAAPTERRAGPLAGVSTCSGELADAEDSVLLNNLRAQTALAVERVSQFELYVSQLRKLKEIYASANGPALSPDDKRLVEESPEVVELVRAEVAADVEATVARKKFGPEDSTVKDLQVRLNTIRDKLCEVRTRRLSEIAAWKRDQAETQYLEYQEALLQAREQLAVLEAQPADYPARLEALGASDPGNAFAFGEELASLPQERGFQLLKEHWDTMDNIAAKQQLLKAWYFRTRYPLRPRNHPRIIDVLHLGVSDSSPQVQSWAFEYLRSIAFADFSENHAEYLTWYATQHERPLRDVLNDACMAFVERLRAADANSRPALARLLGQLENVFRGDELVRRTAMATGLPEVLATWLGRGDLSAEAVRAVCGVVRALNVPEAYLRLVIVPLTLRGQPLETRAAAFRVLGRAIRWAIPHLLELLVQTLADENERRQLVWPIAQALAEMDDPAVIPTMIAVIAADDTYDTVYGVGYFGLGKLTGVSYDESHDAAWWRQWWEGNKARYPVEVQSRPIPTIPPAPQPGGLDRRNGDAPQGDAADVADTPAKDLRAGGDEQKRYFLIGPPAKDTSPADGYRLLLVLPGNDGSADFHPFVKRIYKNALPPGWIVAQLVAPQWSSDQAEQIVWPTRDSPWKGMKFSTEEFVAAVIADVREQQKLGVRESLLLGWSSGGPACYATALQKDSPVAGAFIAMSVFKPPQLPPLDHAKGRAFYVLHSPTDFIPIRMAEQARDDLHKSGATVEFQTYEGGHGWKGDVFGMIRAGVEWLGKSAGAGDRK